MMSRSLLVFVAYLLVELRTVTVGSSPGQGHGQGQGGGDATTIGHDHCIIGAGPGGLQLAYYMNKAGRDYIVFERNNISGSFYAKYPRHRKLISINKRFTGETNTHFNMRHDWNSLLSDDPTLLYRHYSSDFYPSADTMTKYLQDYSVKNKLNIKYNTEIYDIQRVFCQQQGQQAFIMKERTTNVSHNCKSVILATGLAIPNAPELTGSEYLIGYEDVSTNPDDFTGKSVLILGRGNAAFETADSIYGETNLVHMVGRNRARLAWSTHYVGDLRAINNVLLDNYQLKSLDGLLETDVNIISIAKDEHGKLFLNFSDLYKSKCNDGVSIFNDNFALRTKYDYIIRCLGFVSDMSPFHSSTRPTTTKGGKYAALKNHYESTNIPGLFFAGALSHQVDYRKSAGGFVHGYRYTARTLFKILEQKYHAKKWESRRYEYKDVMNVFVKRINDADALYQMFSVLGDVFLLDRETKTLEHYMEFPIKSLQSFESLTGVKTKGKYIIVLNFEYGQDFSGPGEDTFREARAVGSAELAHKSNFLHPVFYFYKKLPSEMLEKNEKYELPKPDFLHHIVEDFLTDFTAQVTHLTPLRRFIEHILETDMRTFSSEFCLSQMLTSNHLPEFCHSNLEISLHSDDLLQNYDDLLQENM